VFSLTIRLAKNAFCYQFICILHFFHLNFLKTLKKTLKFFSGTIISVKYNRILKSLFKMYDHKYFLTNISIVAAHDICIKNILYNM